MAESGARWEQALLAEAAAAVAYPATPELRARVVAAVGERAAGRARRWAPPLTVNVRLAAAVATLALALVALLAVPASRDAVAEFFGLVPGQRFEQLPLPPEPARPAVTTTPQARPFVLPTPWSASPATPPPIAATPTPAPAVPTPVIELARPSTLAAASQALGYEIALPRGEGEPLAVFFIDFVGQGAVVLRYARFDLWQTNGPGTFGKGAKIDTIVEVADVGSIVAYWIEGEARVLRFLDANGDEVPGSRREVSRNTLIWLTATSFYRLEGDLTREQAIAIGVTLP